MMPTAWRFAPLAVLLLTVCPASALQTSSGMEETAGAGMEILLTDPLPLRPIGDIPAIPSDMEEAGVEIGQELSDPDMMEQPEPQLPPQQPRRLAAPMQAAARPPVQQAVPQQSSQGATSLLNV